MLHFFIQLHSWELPRDRRQKAEKPGSIEPGTSPTTDTGDKNYSEPGTTDTNESTRRNIRE